jgi:hypothetical protein
MSMRRCPLHSCCRYGGHAQSSACLTLRFSPYRWALLPVILAKILLSPPAQDPPSTSTSGAASTSANEALAVEQRLLRTIIEFLQFSYQFQIDQQRQVRSVLCTVLCALWA